jgi:alpha-amylase/alpha-mannosidase (GH57 family)
MIIIHGHFYQPPREDPWLEAILPEPSAAPYRHWNERIAYECYEPNALLGNYTWISFDFGPTLLDWLRRRRPHVYGAIIEADKIGRERWGHGNAIAHPYYHAILPLLDRKDKEVLVEWGIKHFERHFERYPEGMWLPEMAVDVETLEVLAQYDVKFTILTQRQIKGGGPGGPYEVLLPSGRKILVFVRDEALSDKIAFGGPDELPKAMEAAPRDGVTLVALDGETFGHHKKGEERVLATATAKYGAYMANLGHAADRIKPLGVVEIVPGTSWSCPHGLGRWTRDCGCGGPAPWRQPLREAINWLNDAVDEAFERWSNSRGVDGWMLLKKYVEVLLGKRAEDFAREAAPSIPPRELLSMLEMERAKLAANTSDAWFFARLGLEAGISVKWAVRALELLGDRDALDKFTEMLKDVKGEPAGNAAALIPTLRGPVVVVSIALASTVSGYSVEELGPYQITLNGAKVRVVDRRTLEIWELDYSEFGVPVLRAVNQEATR